MPGAAGVPIIGAGGIKKASALRYNFNFPHVPFGTHL
jgi:hypothetical protein